MERELNTYRITFKNNIFETVYLKADYPKKAVEQWLRRFGLEDIKVKETDKFGADFSVSGYNSRSVKYYRSNYNLVNLARMKYDMPQKVNERTKHKLFKVPVEWEMMGEITVEANSFAEAIKKVRDGVGSELVQGLHGEYIAGSFKVNSDKGQSDKELADELKSYGFKGN